MREMSPKRASKEHDHHMHFFNRKSPEMFQIMNIEWLVEAVKIGLKITGMSKLAYRNALNVQVVEHEIYFPELPAAFDGYTILLMTDLHIDGMPELQQVIHDLLDNISYDICLLGGDYRFNVHGSTAPTTTAMAKLLETLCPRSKVVGVLGNHDHYEIGQAMESAGAQILMNENITISRGNDTINICGIDDCHYYGGQDLDQCLEGVNNDAFKILLTHSPEIYREAEEQKFNLLLAGHTHGGQLCLPGRFSIIFEANIPRSLGYSNWKYKSMQGYTSCGTGSSGTPARLNCPPEIALLTLRKK